jgi:hypothetical protein
MDARPMIIVSFESIVDVPRKEKSEEASLKTT